MCLFHKYKFMGQYYMEYASDVAYYGVNVYDVFCCSKCGKVKSEFYESIESCDKEYIKLATSECMTRNEYMKLRWS